tara:strand:+ start:480 stop:710 length:231 start_codon:yes stop_codon:yes gene_type:complete
MHIKKLLNSFYRNKHKPFTVGQRLASKRSKNVLIIKREVFISGIKHYSISIEAEPWKKTTLLSESALQEGQYVPLP